MQKCDIAIIGLGVMGQNLARNLAGRNLDTLVYNRHSEKTEIFLKEHGNGHLSGAADLKELASKLKTPRKILLMVKAGEAVDAVIEQLLPYLETGDIIIDGGNSHFWDTIRRTEALIKEGIHFVGMGVSGGEEGALHGPSLMPGGSEESWQALRPILEKIAAKDFSGNPCVTHVGQNGAGHYVKMVHNGIEYGVMQMMAEAYFMLKNLYNLSPPQLADISRKFGEGKLKSYLFDIAVPILEKKDDLAEGYLIDKILDKAGQKGTGSWVAIDALERGVSLPTITMAVFARCISSQKNLRVNLSQTFGKPKSKTQLPLNEFLPQLEKALYAGMISSYAQGFELMAKAAQEQNWNLNFAEITRIWQGGCIIRADLLKLLHNAFESASDQVAHLFSIPEISRALSENLEAWRSVVSMGISYGLPLPSLATSLTYFEEATTETLSANFIQGLRDNFGAHTFERTDREGVFHAEWMEP